MGEQAERGTNDLEAVGATTTHDAVRADLTPESTLAALESSLEVPFGARKLGCLNCRVGDRARHPELGMLYCYDCPVSRRRRHPGCTHVGHGTCKCEETSG